MLPIPVTVKQRVVMIPDQPEEGVEGYGGNSTYYREFTCVSDQQLFSVIVRAHRHTKTGVTPAIFSCNLVAGVCNKVAR